MPAEQLKPDGTDAPPTPSPAAAAPRVRPGLLTRELPGGDVVLTTADGATAVILNATAQAIVELCDGTRPVDEVVRFVLDLLPDASQDEVMMDVSALVDRLASLGLLDGQGLESCGSGPSIA